MPVKSFKPITPGRRQMTVADFAQLTKKVKPTKSLIVGKRKKAGRASHGKIAVRHQGGGVKQRLRMVDFGDYALNTPGRVASIEYDPGRTGYIMLVVFKNGDKRYVLATSESKVGDEIVMAHKTPLKVGNRAQLRNILPGTAVHNIELHVGKGGQIVRSAGSSATIMARDGDWVTVKLPSSEIRRVHGNCFATIGRVSNIDHNLIVIGKAGRSRLMGRRPTVRGSVMNPVDHPHGGGEGRAPIGLKKGPKTPWGKKAMGVATRRNKRTDVFIITRRKKKK